MIRDLLPLDGPPGVHPETDALRPALEPELARDRPIIRVTEPLLGPEERAKVLEVLDSGFVSSAGPAVTDLEAELAARCGTEAAVAVTCGTHALDLLLHCLNVGPGDEVVVPALTFISVAACVVRAGARPVFVDVECGSLNMDVAAVESAIGPATKGIIAVHTFGHPIDMDALRAICDRRGLFLLEDACESLGAEVRGRPVGGLGDAGFHSFYANKMMTTGNGGAITSSHPELLALLRQLRGYSYAPRRMFWHPHMPFNVRMSALEAALGIAQLRRLDDIMARKARIADHYRRRLSDVRGLRTAAACDWGRHANWTFVIHVDVEAFGRSAPELRGWLANDGIETRAVFAPLHVQPVLQRAAGLQGPFPNAAWAASTGILLPSGAGLTEVTLDRICDRVIAGAVAR